MYRNALIALAVMALMVLGAFAGMRTTTPLASRSVSQADVLDLTKRETEAGTPRMWSLGGPPAPSHGDPPPMPVVITLASMEKNSYRRGEPLVFEVVLKADREVTIPWSTSARTMGTEARDATDGGIEFHIGLEVVGDTAPPNRVHTLGTIFGSNRLPGSLRTLRPGEAVTIRVPGHWQSLFFEERGALPPTVRVRAYLSAMSRTDRFRKLYSENAVLLKTIP